eukprot:COSAG02_NODE_11882_length_1635_cov_1.891276_2_plen_196_part_00
MSREDATPPRAQAAVHTSSIELADWDQTVSHEELASFIHSPAPAPTPTLTVSPTRPVVEELASFIHSPTQEMAEAEIARLREEPAAVDEMRLIGGAREYRGQPAPQATPMRAVVQLGSGKRSFLFDVVHGSSFSVYRTDGPCAFVLQQSRPRAGIARSYAARARTLFKHTLFRYRGSKCARHGQHSGTRHLSEPD